MKKTVLTYYRVPRENFCLAVVRYTLYDEFEKIFVVSEFLYQDTPEDFCEMEDDIESALANGIDVSVMSRYENEVFPILAEILD